MIGKAISHYKIIEKLGEGGMGVVYKARDLKLERYVALKFLSPRLSSGEDEKKRFIQEAKAASALDHTNICTIYEIVEIKSIPGESGEDNLFISMAYYEGETLAHKIKDERLKIKEVIDYTIQIAEGLARAHESHIIHRDIKPANIMITIRGEIKILDFGLAKLSDRTRLTQDATTMGTAAYMSPEQIKGDPVDHRTDIWSLGVVLYEMIAGRSPFKGEYDQSLMYAIVNEEPEPLEALRSDTPKELTEIINKAMRKNPVDRYQNLDEFVVELKQIRNNDVSETAQIEEVSEAPLRKPIWHKYVLFTVGIISIIFIIYGLQSLLKEKDEGIDLSTQDKFIAVLPFESITNTEEDRIFSEGIFEDIITQLVKIKDFKVIDRRSVGRYRDSAKNYREIGGELGVNFIVSGSIRQISDKIRINARLIETNSKDIIWAESYDQENSDIFTIQKDVAQKIASTLKVILTPEEQDILDRKPTENMDAYEYYQKGNYYWYNYASKETNIKAAEMYQIATELDPNFALAFAKHAFVNIVLYTERDDPSKERLEKAKRSLEKVEELAPDLPETFLSQGFYYEHIEKKYEKALEAYEMGLRLQPNNADILDDLGTFYLRERAPEKALDYFIRSFNINPYGFWSGLWVSLCYTQLRNWKEAEQWVDIYISNHPDHPFGYLRKWEIILYGRGNLAEASKVINEGRQHSNAKFVLPRIIIELYARKYKEALSTLVSDSLAFYNEKSMNNFFQTINYTLQKALIYRLLGDVSGSEQYYSSARKLYENLIKEDPDRAGYYSNLGIIWAGLGNKTSAIQMGKKAVEMIPVKSEHFLISEQMQLNLAYIYIMTGELEEAIEQIDYLLSIPSQLTIWRLKLDPIYNPLKSHPTFQRLLARIE